jgi:hypothetical protein
LNRIVPGRLRPGLGGHRRQAPGRAVHAGSHDLGEDQESSVQPNGRAAGVV